ncbi:protein kintoun-like [Diadema setosum]|uniref:protein kintoun-like n=1 Tax=Diadema setosum TaxID=31175 RepID=UPI003B3B36FD
MASSGPFEGLDVTADEVQRIQKALKNEEFRKLFVDYANELADPENRRKYEEELAELERSRGMDVKFLHPKPGYVLKTSINGEKKAFINICKNDIIGKPHADKSQHKNGKPGVQWSLPYSLAPGRDDLDHAGKKCVVYDCLFHPECFELSIKDARFRTLMENTAMDGIEREFQVTLDRNNVKKPKMKFKGKPQATIIRTPNQQGATGENSLDAVNLTYPYDKPKSNDVPGTKAKTASKITGNRKEKTKVELGNPEERTGDGDTEKNDAFTEPKYSIVHRGHFDLQQFTYARDSMPSTRPQELIVKVQLPLLKSAASVQLDVFEKRLFLECQKPVSYRLNLPLPYPVDEEKGSARFDKSKACLIITLEVLPPEVPKISSVAPEVIETKPLIEEITAEEMVTTQNGPLSTSDGEPTEIVASKEEVYNTNMYEEMNGTPQSEKGEMFEPELSSDKVVDEAHSSDVFTERENCVDQPAGADAVIPENQNDTAHPHDAVTPSDSALQCDFYQAEDCVTIIIRSTDIDSESLTAVLEDGGKILRVSASRKSSEMADHPPTEFQSLVIQCAPQQYFDEVLATSVSKSNAVVTVKKQAVCRGPWTTFSAGVSMETLQEKMFLTNESLEAVLEVTNDAPSSGGQSLPCTVTEFSAQSVKAEFQMTDSALEVQDTDHGDNVGESKESQDPAESLLPALDLGLEVEAAKQESDSDPQSSPSTASLPSGLKSALRSPRRRACKSVSFSEDVLVELFLEGPNRTQKGGNRKRGRRSPFFGPKRRIEKLKDNSWESYSDSELLHRTGGLDDDEHEEQEGPEWDLQPSPNLVRQSSSESESGPDIPSSPRNKGKKSKGSRRRRKEKARREASLIANKENSALNGEDASIAISNDNEGPATSHKQPQDSEEYIDEADTAGSENGREPDTQGDADLRNNNEIKSSDDNDDLPLEMQDHKTKCAFEFSNQVIFELDE